MTSIYAVRVLLVESVEWLLRLIAAVAVLFPTFGITKHVRTTPSSV